MKTAMKTMLLASMLAATAATGSVALRAAAPQATAQRPRAREIGLRPGALETGALNAITDVEGVRVGHATLVEGDRVRTGVTVVIPHGGNLFQEKVPAAVYVGNGFGKLAGSTQVEELGVIETPIALTNTLSVWRVAEALVEYTLGLPGNEKVISVNPLVGETNDGALNDIRGLHLQKHHVIEALGAARGGAVEEGAVGAGAGTTAFGYKGGIGTASRRLPAAPERALRVAGASTVGATVGVLVQSNFGGVLTMDGVPVGRELGSTSGNRGEPGAQRSGFDGSIIIVVATDAPLDARQLKRLARRAMLGLARTGSTSSHGSGDYVIAFSTAPSLRYRFGSAGAHGRTVLADDSISPLFQAVVEATEEAIYNSMLKATTTRGFGGRVVEALPVNRLREILKKYGR